MVRTPLRVGGIHPGAFRFNVYLDRSQLAAFGAPDVANELYVLPASGATTDDVKRDLFVLDGVASVQPVAAMTKILKDSLATFTSIFRVLQLFILGLALLIAYNATSINADERARERATLFAFGLPLRRVIALETVEGLVHGVIGTLIGLGVGLGVVHWVANSILTSTMPDMSLDVIVSSGTVALAAVLGVAAVGIAPLLTIRRLRRMDIPGTLRIVE
jgi:putative ABC transport system permease protein